MTKTMVSTHAITGGVDTHAGDGRGRVARRAAQELLAPRTIPGTVSGNIPFRRRDNRIAPGSVLSADG
jgi:hypothetical protein